jgi:hypothetical protein
MSMVRTVAGRPQSLRPTAAKVVALGNFCREVTVDGAARQVLILVEWESEAAFESYRDEPAIPSPGHAGARVDALRYGSRYRRAPGLGVFLRVSLHRAEYDPP